MRILHVLDHSAPLQSGYVFRTLSILREQRRLGWETVQLTGPKQGRVTADLERIDGFEFHRTRPAGGWLARQPGAGELCLMRELAKRLSEVARASRPDILHAHSPVLNALPALWVARELHLPLVYEVRAFWEDAAVSHGSEREGGPRYLATRWLETFALRRADAVTTICEGLRSDMVKRGLPGERITIIPNAVDIEEFPPIRARDQALAEELGLADCEVLGFIGSFYAYEGLHLLLEALALLKASRPKLRVLLVGGGPEEAELRRLSGELGIADRTVFAGRVPHSTVQRYYSLVDLLVYPRLRIRLTDLVTPLKPLEAMAQEKLLLASDVGGHRELIRDGETGFLFPADDASALARRAVEALEARERWPAMRANGRRFVEQERNWTRSVSYYQPLYERLREARPTASGAAAAAP
ncbi:MAG: glycosyltransferase, exosortase A system-associated [Alphaproteobacteria bacterium]|nr:glycosyltransferase, exosortase A system-associated [Alphaproteobacteria bacterium]